MEHGLVLRVLVGFVWFVAGFVTVADVLGPSWGGEKRDFIEKTRQEAGKLGWGVGEGIQEKKTSAKAKRHRSLPQSLLTHQSI